MLSKHGYVEKIVARNQLLYGEHLTVAIIWIDVNQEGFLNLMSIVKALAHQDKLLSITACRFKKSNCATSASCGCRKKGKLCTSTCHMGRGVNTLRTLCKMEKWFSINNWNKHSCYQWSKLNFKKVYFAKKELYV